MNYLNATRHFLTKMQNEINHTQQSYIYIPLLLINLKLLIFNLLIPSNILICHYFAIAIYYILLLLIYFNYWLSFPINGFNLISILSYLVCSKPQHKVTSTNLWRHFSILLCQMLEALGQALTIDNHRCSLLFWSCYPLGTDKTLGKCIFFLQPTPLQNWILLSVYLNRSENLRAAVTTH